MSAPGKILNRIFLKKLGLVKFIFSGVAFITGFTLVLLSLQVYIKIREHLAPAKSDFVIISKEVVMVHTLLGGRAEFSRDEITDLRRQPFVEDLAEFKSNHFEVVAQAGGDMGIVTELFFESVPAKFIDGNPVNFSWREGDDFLPVIVSQEFLDLYNFGFASGKGSRQLSKSTIQLVPIKIRVEGTAGRKVLNARVVGFSERIPSVLVPADFIAWANKHIGGTDDLPASRLIIKVKRGGSSGLARYLDDHNFVAGAEKMRLGKLLSALDIFMTASLIVGVGFIAFALVIIVLNFSLIVSQAKDEVALLLQLGYTDTQLALHLVSYLLVFVFTSITVSALLWYLTNNQMVGLLSRNGMEITRSITPEVAITAIVFVGVFLSVSVLVISKLVRNI